MKLKVFKPLIWLGILILVVSLACNLSSAPASPTQTLPPPPTQPPAPSPTTAPVDTPQPIKPKPTQSQSGAVSSLGDVQKAIIQIEAEGTFVDPQEGWNINVGKRGSGFIIDPSGIAVTNNHVATGAAILRVWVGGETAKTYNAKILGVSECSDLAVIKIDGEDFPYLDWFGGEIKVGLRVYAAGFPLGDPAFTLTDGIVSKTAANGDSSWASVKTVIEHTAKINPGNSGGPLVDENGKVIGINYSSIAQYEQNFAISRDTAKPVIEQLRSSKNIDSIGVNGIAVSGNINGMNIYGVWVRSVASGSPADKALIQPADIIYQMEGEVLATDGTMKSYCEILRSRNPTDTMGVTIIRYGDPSLPLLEGQINGRNLSVTGSFTGGSTAAGEATPTGEAVGGAYTYVKVKDNTNTIEVEIPSAWSDINGEVWTSDWGGLKFDAPSITAASNLTDYNSYKAPGVFFAASDRLGQIGGFVELLDGVKGWYENDCKFDGRNEYGKEGGYYDILYEGKFDLWKNCGGTNTEVMVLAARPKADPTAYLMLVEVRILSEADLEALIHILDSFEVIGSF